MQDATDIGLAVKIFTIDELKQSVPKSGLRWGIGERVAILGTASRVKENPSRSAITHFMYISAAAKRRKYCCKKRH